MRLLIFGLILLSCIAAQTAAAAEGILPDDAQWSGSPGFREPQWMPDPPAFEGWRHYLGNLFEVSMIPLDGKVLVGTNQDMRLIDVHSGEVLWLKHDLLSLAMANDWVCNGPQLFLSQFQGIRALELASGDLIWEQPGFIPLAHCDAGLWATRPDAGAGGPAELGRDIYLLDSRSGAILQHFETGELRGCLKAKYAAHPRMALCTTEQGMILKPDGSSETFALATPGRPCRMALNSRGVFMLFHDDLEVLALRENGMLPKLPDPPGGDDGYDANYRIAVTTQDCAFHNTSDPASSWQQEIALGGWRAANMSLWPECTEDFVVIPNRGGLLLLHVPDGSERMNLPTDDSTLVFLRRLDEKELFYTSFDRSTLTQRFHRIQLDDGSSSELAIRPQDVFALADSIQEGSAVLLEASHHLSPFKNNYWISGLRLDGNYSTSPGEMQLLSRPYEYSELAERFLASPDPLMDRELLLHLSVEGSGAIASLLRQTDPGDVTHLDALAAATVYLQRVSTSEYDPANPLLQFMESLYDLPHLSELLPHLIRWSEDESVPELHSPLRGLLASLNEPAADEYLSLEPLRGLIVGHELQGHFYVIPAEGGGAYSRWAETTAEDGRRFAAYVADGTVGSHDIYIALDADNNGIFEQAFPTGLSDWPDHFLGPDGEHAKEIAPLGLRVEDAVLLIAHYEAVMQTEEMFDRQVNFIGTASLKESSLNISELLSDSDSDGVSDSLEFLMFTDPAVADSDADGTAEGLDSTPNLDLARLPSLERGLARGLAFAFDSSYLPRNLGLRPTDDGHPIELCYFQSTNAGPVAYGNESIRGIAVSAEEAEALRSLDPDESLPRLVKLLSLDQRGPPAISSPVVNEGHGAEFYLDWVRQSSWQFERFATADLLLFIMSENLDYVVALREINGELQPYAIELI